jgi:hypothetical protein
VKVGRRVVLGGGLATLCDVGVAVTAPSYVPYVRLKNIGAQDKSPPIVWLAPAWMPVARDPRQIQSPPEGWNVLTVMPPSDFVALVELTRRQTYRRIEDWNAYSVFEIRLSHAGSASLMGHLRGASLREYVGKVMGLPDAAAHPHRYWSLASLPGYPT